MAISSSGYAVGLVGNALPTGGNVGAGTATIIQNGNTMTISQSTQQAVINWDSFNVGKNATVNFYQPNNSASTLNRVKSTTKSMINGALNANGEVIFINPNGVVFGKGAEINAGAITATTMDIKDSDYLKGNMSFSGNESGQVVNKGKITANNINGYIALMAPAVRNEGVLTAMMSGDNAIALVSGQRVTLSFNGNQLSNVSVDASTIKSLISNKRLIQVDGGQVIIAANSVSDLKNSVINNIGVVSANGFNVNGGKISLIAATVNQNATLTANSDVNNGGQITISGNQVNLNSISKTTAIGETGGGEVFIGKTSQESSISAQSNIKANIVNIAQGAVVDVSARKTGNGGKIEVWSQTATNLAGTLRANGGQISGNGGNIDTSSAGKVSYIQGLVVDTTAPYGIAGNWATNPQTIIIDSLAASILSNALKTTNITLEASASSCSGLSNCSNGGQPLIALLADVYSANPFTSLTLSAQGGTINIDSNITAGAVHAVAQAINVNGSINTNGGANSAIYLAATIINILGNINSNGSSSNNTGSSNLNSVNTITANNRRRTSLSPNSFNTVLSTDANTYSSNGGEITIIATNNINIASKLNNNSYISANGLNGGVINIISLHGDINNYGVVDALGIQGIGGNISLATNNNIFSSSLIATDGFIQGGIIQIGIANNIGSGSTLAPPSINSQVATLLAGINFTPSINSTLIASKTSLDNSTFISSSAVNSNTQQVQYSQAGQIILVGNDSLNTAASIFANADKGGLIILSSPVGNYQNTGNIQTNGSAGLGGTVAQSGLISTSLLGTLIEANGTLGGGNIVIGRDFQAIPLSASSNIAALLPRLSNSISLPTSALTMIDSASTLVASASQNGHGGNILTYGQALLANGAFIANGGSLGGNGGFVETSGDYLQTAGISVLTKSFTTNSKNGSWLLDPYDVIIAARGVTTSSSNPLPTYAPNDTSIILTSDISNSLNAGTNVTITTGSASANTIYVIAPILATSANGGSLTLTGGTIYLQANITTVGAQIFNGAVTLGSNVLLNTNNSPVSFLSTVDSVSNGAYGLAITNGFGDVFFGDNVGSSSASSALGTLIITGGNTPTAQTTTLGGHVTTIGVQSYGGNLSLTGSNIVLTSSDDSVNILGNVISNVPIADFLGNGSFAYSNNAGSGGSPIGWATDFVNNSASFAPGTVGAVLDNYAPISVLTINSGTGAVVIGGNVSNLSALFINSSSTDSKITGVISGPTNLVVNTGTRDASGVLSLLGSNTYTGITTINSGATLALVGSGSIASSSAVNVDGTFDISQTSGSSIKALNDVLSGGGNGVVNLGNQRLTIGSIFNAGSFSGVIQDNGGGSLVITETGYTQTLSGINTYTGSTTINNGATLVLSGNASIASSNVVNLAGVLDINNNNAILASLQMTGSGVITNSTNDTSSLYVDGPATNYVFSYVSATNNVANATVRNTQTTTASASNIALVVAAATVPTAVPASSAPPIASGSGSYSFSLGSGSSSSASAPVATNSGGPLGSPLPSSFSPSSDPSSGSSASAPATSSNGGPSGSPPPNSGGSSSSSSSDSSSGSSAGTPATSSNGGPSESPPPNSGGSSSSSDSSSGSSAGTPATSSNGGPSGSPPFNNSGSSPSSDSSSGSSAGTSVASGSDSSSGSSSTGVAGGKEGASSAKNTSGSKSGKNGGKNAKTSQQLALTFVTIPPAGFFGSTLAKGQERYALLPDEDGKVGAITVTVGKNRALVKDAFASIDVNDKVPTRGTADRNTVKQIYQNLQEGVPGKN